MNEVSNPAIVPRVSVVVPHFDDLVGLDLCLKALSQQSLPPDAYEVIVSDNGSRCGLLAVLNVVGRRGRVVVAKEKGAGPARNVGIRAARGEIIALTDSDCLPDPDWLVRGLESLEGYSFVGGAMRVETAAPVPTPSEAFELVFAFRNEVYVRRKGFSVTANLFAPRYLFHDVGFFSNGLSEDLEWCQRARSRGHSIGYAGEALVSHPARRTWPELRTKWKRLTFESFGLAQRTTLGPLVWLGRSYLVLASAVPDLVRTLTSQSLPDMRARLGAAAVLLRLRLFRFLEAHRLFLQRLKTPRPPMPLSTSRSG